MARRFSTLSELAAEANVSDETLRRWVQSGALPAHKLAGTTWRVDRRDWRDFLSKSRTDGDMLTKSMGRNENQDVKHG